MPPVGLSFFICEMWWLNKITPSGSDTLPLDACLSQQLIHPLKNKPRVAVVVVPRAARRWQQAVNGRCWQNLGNEHPRHREGFPEEKEGGL